MNGLIILWGLGDSFGKKMFKYDLMKQSIDSKFYLVLIVSSSQNLAHVHVVEVGSVAWPFLYEIHDTNT